MAPERSQERIPLSDQRRILSADIREILAGRTVIYDDREPLNDYDGKIGLGSELAVSFSQIREHRRPTEFKKQ